MQKTILNKTASGSTHEAPKVKAQPFRTEQIIDNLADKEQTIRELEEEIRILKRQNNDLERSTEALERSNKDLDYLLNSGRNKFEQQRIKRLKELETKIKQLEDVKAKEIEPTTKIQGILTSNLRTRISSNTPFMAFIRPFRNCEKHSWEECEKQKCQDCETPVVFRTNEIQQSPKCCLSNSLKCDIPLGGLVCRNQQRLLNSLSKPQLNKGDRVILEGI